MPVIMVAADAFTTLIGTCHEIFAGSVIVRRFVLKNDLPAITGQTRIGKADDQQKVKKQQTIESERGKSNIEHRTSNVEP